MKLSIVSTLYESAPHILEFYERTSLIAKKLVGEDYEIVLVNDGSPDNSLDLSSQLADDDHHVILVDLSRNFGHHKAMMTGLSYAKGDHIFLIDSDLEEEPEWLIKFSKELSIGVDVVYGVQIIRKGSWFERWSGRLYYKILSKFLGIELPENVVTARLMTRRFVDALLKHDEREMFLGGLFSLAGFKQIPVTVKKHSTSVTTYTFNRKMVLLINTVTAFSNVPLLIIFYFGLFLSIASVSYVAFISINWIFFSAPPSGWTSVIASIWLLGGMIISFLGVIGIYLSKIFVETKRRPYTIVRRIYGVNSKQNNL